MDSVLVEALLNEDESTALDFKREQYRFTGASDDDKSELLKDILAFANSWRRSDAFILIGIEEFKGRRSLPLGVDQHLEDAQLQQFVNSKVQRQLIFEYCCINLSGHDIGAIRIPVQPRPFFLTKDYGRLKKDVVYVRHGSSTAIASLDEILKMHAASVEASAASLDLAIRANDSSNLDFVIGICNAPDAAPASAPYLEFEVPETYSVAPYGLDGYGQHGLPLVPQSGRDAKIPKFRGDTNTVIYPGTTCDVTRIKRNQYVPVLKSITIKYKVAAANSQLRAGSITIDLSATAS